MTEPKATAMNEDPLQQLLKLRDRMNRLFEDSMTRFSSFGEGNPVGHWTPPADVHEEAGRLVVRVELPGMRREDVDLTVDEGTLVLRGERSMEAGHRPEDYHRLERSYGPFLRSFRLPLGIDSAAVKAEMHDGILVVTIPKPSGGTASKVQIRVE